MNTLLRLHRRLLPVALGLLTALPASAFVNEIEIMVARGRLGQCGGGWDPQHSGRWSGGTGSIWVQGRKLHEFNLADPAECDRVVKTRVDASADQRIEVLVVNQGGSNRMGVPLTTVAADRVWQVEYFADQAWGSVLSTATPTPAPPAAPPHAQRGYQLYFDGKLVSGPDAASYTRQQAVDNCAWNRRTKPHLRIECVYEGHALHP